MNKTVIHVLKNLIWIPSVAYGIWLLFILAWGRYDELGMRLGLMFWAMIFVATFVIWLFVLYPLPPESPSNNDQGQASKES